VLFYLHEHIFLIQLSLDQDHVEAKDYKILTLIRLLDLFTCLVGISLYLSSPSGGTPISF